MYTNELAMFLNFWNIQILNSLEVLNEPSLTLPLTDDLESLFFNMVCQALMQKYRRKENTLHSILFVNDIIRVIRFDLQLTVKLTRYGKWLSNI